MPVIMSEEVRAALEAARYREATNEEIALVKKWVESFPKPKFICGIKSDDSERETMLGRASLFAEWAVKNARRILGSIEVL